MIKENRKKYSILIVDDEPLIRQSLYEILRIDGYPAQMASNAGEGLKLLARDDFSLKGRTLRKHFVYQPKNLRKITTPFLSP